MIVSDPYSTTNIFGECSSLSTFKVMTAIFNDTS